MRIKARRRAVGRAIALAPRLDPNKGILERIARVGRRPHAEARALDVAPIAPGLLRRRLHAVARRIRNKMRRVARGHEQGRQRVDVLFLIAVGVALRVGGARRRRPGVVVCHVGGQAAHGGGLAGRGVQLAEQRRRGLDVGGPAEPAGVAGVEVHAHVGQVELLHGVGDALLVGGSGVGAFLHTQVCYQVA